MPEFRYFPKGQTRTIIDYNAIIELIALGECAVVCLPMSVVGIIRKLLLDRGLWRTTYVMGYTETGYYIPTEVEFHPLRQEILTALEELNDMSCTSDFRLGLADVANAIRALANAQCCSTVGVSIVQGTGEDGGVTYGTEPPIGRGDPETDPPPDGYDSWEEWFDQLCQNANALVDSFVTTLSNLSYLSVFNLSLLVAAVGAFILLPPAISPMLLFWLAQLVLSLSTLRDLGDWISSNKNEMVCAIYDAADAAAAQTAIRAVLRDGLTEASVDEALHETIINIAMALLSTDTLNQLYSGDMRVVYPNAVCDCELCGVGDIQIYNDGASDWGTITDDITVGGQRTIEITSTFVDGAWRAGLTTGFTNPDCCWIVSYIIDGINTQNDVQGTWYDCNGDAQQWPAGGSDEIVTAMLASTGFRAFQIVYTLGGPWTWTVTVEMA